MTNPFSGIITTAHKALFNNMIDSLLENTALTVPVDIIYNTTKFQNCPHCTTDPIGNKPAAGSLTGGRVPLGAISICSLCNGSQKVPLEVDPETVYMAVIRDYKNFMKLGYNVEVTTGHVQTIAKINVLPKLQQAKEIIISSDIVPYVREKFIKAQTLQPIGWGDSSYVIGVWKKIE